MSKRQSYKKKEKVQLSSSLDSTLRLPKTFLISSAGGDPIGQKDEFLRRRSEKTRKNRPVSYSALAVGTKTLSQNVVQKS
jgi:hypothetical protein